ncbi:SAV_2336 N-terminal domain-related protein [Nocardia wallacei]|uniref:SAV_2336 N-terminal domain-related protein n=1 Tax=Nocardia wallacei TaxID=480035 RepID=UPI002454DB14|nr:SAV_2336 N-terminal domain-related protein [Nocardia wallacei]
MESLSELLEALRGLDVDGDTVAEALYLAKHITDQPDSAVPQSHSPPEIEPEAIPPPLPDAGTAHALLPRDSGAVTLPGSPGAWPARAEIDVPAPSPLESGASLLGDLRPLAQRLPDPRETVFDEDASVDRTARTGVAWPVTTPRLVRRRDAALVFDRHPSMAAWSGLAAAVRRLVDSVGFRQVTVWYLDEDEAGTLRLATGARRVADRPLSALADPSGRRVVMVFTACLGDAWGWGSAAAQLERLAALSPVAIVQPLPNSLWRRTGLQWGHGRITSVIPDRPSPLRLAAPAGTPTTAIPVLELTPGWIRPWAELLAGQRRTAGYPLLRRVERPDPNTVSTLAVRQDRHLGRHALERVRRFRAASTPEAFRLAASLAQVPLLLPIMRLVQQAVLPGSKPSVLAEVLAGGLIEDTTARSAPPYTIPEDSRVFAFRPDVAEILRDAIPRSEAARVLAAASQFIVQRYDVPGPVFRAAVSQPAEGSGSPFAYLSPDTLRRIAPNFPDPRDRPPTEEEQLGYDAVVREADAAARSGDEAAALTAARHALETVPVGRPERAELLAMLSGLLQRRWENRGDPADLDEAIAVSKAALDELPDTDEPTPVLVRLGDLLMRRFTAVGGGEFLTDATRVLRTALDTAESEDPIRADLSERLGDATLWRSEVTGEPLHGWEAVDLYLAAGRAADESTGAGMTKGGAPQGSIAGGGGTDDRTAILMLKIARAYLDIATQSAYPRAELVDRITEQFRYAAPRLPAVPAPEIDEALRQAVTRVVHAVTTDAMPPAIATTLSSILTTAPATAAVSEARALLDAAGGSDGPR